MSGGILTPTDNRIDDLVLAFVWQITDPGNEVQVGVGKRIFIADPVGTGYRRVTGDVDVQQSAFIIDEVRIASHDAGFAFQVFRVAAVAGHQNPVRRGEFCGIGSGVGAFAILLGQEQRGVPAGAGDEFAVERRSCGRKVHRAVGRRKQVGCPILGAGEKWLIGGASLDEVRQGIRGADPAW